MQQETSRISFVSGDDVVVCGKPDRVVFRLADDEVQRDGIGRVIRGGAVKFSTPSGAAVWVRPESVTMVQRA